MAAFGTTEREGLKITTVTEQIYYQQEHGRTVETEYFTAGFDRVDTLYSHPQGTFRSTHVRDLARSLLMGWEADRPEYRVLDTPPPEAELPLDGPEVILETKTVDTGERKLFFDRMARHLITEQRAYRVDGVKEDFDISTSTTVDGWYVEADSVPASKQHSIPRVLYIRGQASPVTHKHTGPSLEGFAVLVKHTTKITVPEGLTSVTHESRAEVVEWVEGPLSADLFRPPEGYARVTFSTKHEPTEE